MHRQFFEHGRLLGAASLVDYSRSHWHIVRSRDIVLTLCSQIAILSMEKPSSVCQLPGNEDRTSEFQARYSQHLNTLVSEADALFQEYRIFRPNSVLWTPLLHSTWLSEENVSVFVKLETEQVTNSFKVRGALFRTSCALARGAKGVVTASTGNHALAVLHAMKLNNIGGVIFLPSSAKIGKVHVLSESAKGTNAKIEFAGNDCLQAELVAGKYAQQNPVVYISPYNDLQVMAGQGTIGVEILDTLSKLKSHGHGIGRKCCYVTVGGGGLIAGVAACLKAREPGVWRVVGCLPHNSAVMYECVAANKVVECPCLPTLSDGSAGDIENGSITLDYCANLVDAWAIVNEGDIASAIVGMFTQHRKVLEGAAAVAVAGFQVDRIWRDANSVHTAVIVACGGNIDPDVFANIISNQTRH